jgi:hypothetical protein
LHFNESDASETNIPAFAWFTFVIPENAVSFSFDYTIHGDWRDDSFCVAFDGTNAMSLLGKQIETNILFNTGAIDVSAFAGETNELFVGILGGTSTNAQVLIQNCVFMLSPAPSLQAGIVGNRVVLSWQLSAADFVLETTSNLLAVSSWSAITNVPSISNLRNTVTQEISGQAGFYRLTKRQ